MRKVIAIIISIISISLLAHTNVSASYMPTNPIDKDVDGQPAGEEYKDKFEFVLKEIQKAILSAQQSKMTSLPTLTVMATLHIIMVNSFWDTRSKTT